MRNWQSIDKHTSTVDFEWRSSDVVISCVFDGYKVDAGSAGVV